MFLLKLSLLVLASTNVAIAWLLTPVTPCDSSPCKNGATCTNKDETFKCACKEGYFGKTCSERIQCENPLDLLFVVDAFSLQSTGEFDRVRDFMSDIINWLKISDLAAKVGVIEFSYNDDTKVIFLPDMYSDASTLKNAISNLKKNVIKLFHGLEGYIAKALKLANDKVFKTADQHPNAAKAIVLLTQNLPLDSKSRAIEEAEKLKAKGVKIISIDLVTVLKALFNVTLVYNDLTKVSSPLRPISSPYDKLDNHVREVVNQLCSFTKDPCETMDCGERKICSYNRDTTSCIWNKANFEAQPCDETPCKNNGECENIDKETFKCNCTEAWTGVTCEEKVLPCESNPCKNSGVCENVDKNTFKCTCTEDWTSLTCEEKVHPCDKAESPCKNEGTCEKAESQFVCKCAEGWKGSTCEEKVQPCDKSPCKNQAQCQNVNDENFKCQCSDGWKGETCDEKLVSCPVVVEKKGCFKDDQKPPRPLSNYILTDRDSSLKIYSGQAVDWQNWVNYLPDLVCRCAQLAKSKNFKFFGIQYYGECWSGPSHDESSFKEDGISTECVNTEWKQCSDQSKLACAGKQFTNYVYAINS